jgi:hypothetical protein
MRGYKSLIQEAELLAMSPEAVAKFLKKRAKQSMDELDHDPVDEEALRGRSSPLIDLALARCAVHGDLATDIPKLTAVRRSSACSPLERDALARITPTSPSSCSANQSKKGTPQETERNVR